MKTTEIIGLSTLVVLGVLSACGGQNGSQEAAANSLGQKHQSSVSEPVMRFDTLEHDFGTILEGERVVCYFDYINDGGSDLLITSVEATCGCTTPSWSREPVNPGDGRSLELIFDASGRSGVQRKVITVRSNAKNAQIQLTIRANVIEGV